MGSITPWAATGRGVAMMTYLGTNERQEDRRIANYHCAFDTRDFPSNPLYHGKPWFIPIVGRYFRLRDWIDRHI